LNSLYLLKHTKLFDRIIVKKRNEIINIINRYFDNYSFEDALDIGTTDDMEFESSNHIIKNISKVKEYKSISNQKINSKFFKQTLNKSILENLTKDEIKQYLSDIVVSNATIEHVGSYVNQLKMLDNVINLTKKYFIITTPNRFHPIDFHTKIPFIHWLPKRVHRKILSWLNLDYFSKEENLNLLSIHDLKKLLNNYPLIKYKIFNIKFIGFISNFIIIGKINENN
tara:strand:- start:737 stop:1414 length:678 start_codon:yes stop_codon:yes gene_type:complete